MDQTPPQPPSTTTTTTPQPDPTPIPTSQPQQTTPRPSFNTRAWTPQQSQSQSQPQQQTQSHFNLPSSPLPSTSSPRIAIGIPSPLGVVRPNTTRPPVGVIRPNTSINSNGQQQSPTPAPFQGHGMIRVTTTTSPSPNVANANQPWLSSSPGTTTITTQGKPPLPSPSTLRPQTQSFQQRPQQLQTNEHYGTHFTPPRSITQQQQMARAMPSPAAAAAIGSQKSPLGIPPQAQTGLLNGGVGNNKAVVVEREEVSNRVVTKRSIRDILNQIDPREKFEAGVEDVLVDVAEDFVESITRFGCSLAKHRKSSVLEAKDVLLHLEQNWNLTLPGFGGDEIKTYKKPVVSDVHRERISAIRKSSVGSDTAAGAKSVGGQSGGNTKGHVAKGAVAITEAA